jgi:hypothetical protein
VDDHGHRCLLSTRRATPRPRGRGRLRIRAAVTGAPRARRLLSTAAPPMLRHAIARGCCADVACCQPGRWYPRCAAWPKSATSSWPRLAAGRSMAATTPRRDTIAASIPGARSPGSCVHFRTFAVRVPRQTATAFEWRMSSFNYPVKGDSHASDPCSAGRTHPPTQTSQA